LIIVGTLPMLMIEYSRTPKLVFATFEMRDN
jgi:hypothetical protein